MVSDTWYSTIESTLFTSLQYVLADDFDAPFPNLNCTTSNRSESVENVKDFPTLYIHLLPPLEVGQTLTNTEVVAVRATVELQVYSDKSETECRNIITAAIQELKAMHFNVALFPDPQVAADKKYYALARLTRVIASGDSDIVPR